MIFVWGYRAQGTGIDEYFTLWFAWKESSDDHTIFLLKLHVVVHCELLTHII